MEVIIREVEFVFMLQSCETSTANLSLAGNKIINSGSRICYKLDEEVLPPFNTICT